MTFIQAESYFCNTLRSKKVRKVRKVRKVGNNSNSYISTFPTLITQHSSSKLYGSGM